MTIVEGFNPPTSEVIDEPVSTAETPPRAPKEAPAPSRSVTCHYCSDDFSGLSGPARRGLHEKKAHPEEWAKNRVAPKAKKSTAKKAPATKKAGPRIAPTAGAKRASAAEAVTSGLGVAGGLLAKAGDPATGRAIMFSAPAAGEAVDDLIAGTFIDRMVQPFVKGADKWEKVGGILGFPILVAIITRYPDAYEIMEQPLRSATLDVIIGSIPTLKKQKAKERQAVVALADLGEIDETYRNAPDPIGLFIQNVFGYDPATVVTVREGDGPTQ